MKKVIIIICLIMAVLIYLLWSYSTKAQYPVKGVDVSEYQGDIDWDILAKQNIKFAFIKATEGSSYVDEKFKQNFENASKTNLRIGAYHFFSYDSSGKTQAENFINNVPKDDSLLPPVVDVEFYGDKKGKVPDVEETQKELAVMLDLLEDHYGKKPIIYSVDRTYNLYIAGKFDDYKLWMRNVVYQPRNVNWTFWQYSDQTKLEGYNGEEEHIDMNVFKGTESEFNEL